MKLYDLFDGAIIIPFPGRKREEPQQTKDVLKWKRLEDVLKSTPLRDAIIKKLEKMTIDEYGPLLWKSAPDSSPVELRNTPEFALWDNYWKTYIQYPSNDETVLQSKTKRLVQKIRQAGMPVANFSLKALPWKEKTEPNRRFWELKIYFDKPVPSLHGAHT